MVFRPRLRLWSLGWLGGMLLSTGGVMAEPPVPSAASPQPQGYAGSAACRDCHAVAFDAWKSSHHGMAERPWHTDFDAVAFHPPRTLSGERPPQPQAFLDAAGLAKILPEWLDREAALPASRVIGHAPLRQFLVPGPGGRMQAFDQAYDPAKNEWFHLHAGDARQRGDWGHWTGRGMNWNSMCATCHNTRLTKGYQPETDSYQTRMAEISVSCEACHGPMQSHVEWRREHPDHAGPEPGRTIPTRDQMFDTCGACHSRRSELTGDFVPGDSFHDHYRLHGTDTTDVYFPDGQVRDENFEFASFLSSRMHDAGLRCTDCHEPHSGRRLIPENLLCMRCHGGGTTPPAPVIDPTAHSRHGPDSAGNDCTACHMPKTTYMQRHPRHDHGFTIPDPALTVAEGVPNACNRCHSDKDANWAVAQTRQWYGDRPERRPSALRARALAQARRGDATARPILIGLAKTETNAAWLNAICLHLENWADLPEVTATLVSHTRHASPLVREAAVRALTVPVRDGNPVALEAVRRCLEDSRRNVRVASAWALCASIDPQSRPGKELLEHLAQSADQPIGRAQRSQYEFLRGNPSAALAEIRKAIDWDPNAAAYQHDLAMLLASQSDLNGALAALQQACKLAPRDPLFRFKLALAQNEAGKPAEAMRDLEICVQLDPKFGRAWFNLGLAKHAAGDFAQAIVALRHAEALQPDDPAPVHARATIHAGLGQYRELIQALESLKRLIPGDPTIDAWLQEARQQSRQHSDVSD